jgi:hypothetical protein
MTLRKRAIASAAVLAFAALPALAQPSAGPQPTPLPPALAAPQDVAYAGVLTVDVDATDLERRIFRVRQTIPVTSPGPMRILFPQWVPGGHSPRNPIHNIAGLTFRAGGETLA